ncbi:hypothetical protein [Breoghania sp.]|uniref:hypothetical protein n=1 Tax=Breoghania sp. TaxID=2065378 RepID=UPI0029CA43F2|nr:hypothetical protein [Breoghania sp.]
MKLASRFLAAFAVLVCASTFDFPAFARGRLLEVYVAYLGPDDHYNSRGQRLSEPWQVIRQDRANYHRFGIRDRGDEGDRFFASAANRARMERMVLKGFIDGNAGWRVVNDNCWIRVEIYEDSVRVEVR